MRFNGEELLAPRPTPKLEEHPSSAVRHCLFNISAATLHTGGRSSIHNLRMRHAVLIGTDLSQGIKRLVNLNTWKWNTNSCVPILTYFTLALTFRTKISEPTYVVIYFLNCYIRGSKSLARSAVSVCLSVSSGSKVTTYFELYFTWMSCV
jgi:hypothetical protein